MAIELVIPTVGESITEVEVGAWLKAPGDYVRRDEAIVEIESDKATVEVFAPVDGKLVDTGLRKFGALLGDYSEVGCNAVLNPGSIIGRGSVIYPNTNWRGVLASNSIAKNKSVVEVVAKKVV